MRKSDHQSSKTLEKIKATEEALRTPMLKEWLTA